MRLIVHVKPRARTPAVHRLDNEHLVVAVREAPEHGRANAAVVRALAHLGVASSRVRIVSGHTSKTKIAVVDLE